MEATAEAESCLVATFVLCDQREEGGLRFLDLQSDALRRFREGLEELITACFKHRHLLY